MPMVGWKYTILLTVKCMVGNSWESLADESALTCRLSAVSGSYCGDSLPRDMTLAISVIYIMFKTDSYTSSKGFSLAFSATGKPVTVLPTVNLATTASSAAITPRHLTTTIHTPATGNPKRITRNPLSATTTRTSTTRNPLFIMPAITPATRNTRPITKHPPSTATTEREATATRTSQPPPTGPAPPNHPSKISWSLTQGIY